jgi:hypothetical protein
MLLNVFFSNYITILHYNNLIHKKNDKRSRNQRNGKAKI